MQMCRQAQIRTGDAKVNDFTQLLTLGKFDEALDQGALRHGCAG